MCQILRSHPQKIDYLYANWAFQDYNSSLTARFRAVNLSNAFEMKHKDWRSIEKVPYCYQRSSIKFQGYAGKKKTMWSQVEEDH